MTAGKGETWALIPARAGKGKNLWNLGGEPLVTWAVSTAMDLIANRVINESIISSDSDEILIYGEYCRMNKRPEEYSTGEEPIHTWIRDYFLPSYGTPDILLLLQPTSPFCTAEHASLCIAALRKNPDYNSAQTVQKVPHNFHSQNRRVQLKSGQVIFEQQGRGLRKQDKPELWAFGNCLAFRPGKLQRNTTNGCFITPSLGIPIGFMESWDVDTEEDLPIAEAFLPFLTQGEER